MTGWKTRYDLNAIIFHAQSNDRRQAHKAQMDHGAGVKSLVNEWQVSGLITNWITAMLSPQLSIRATVRGKGNQEREREGSLFAILTCFRSSVMVTYSNCRPPCSVGDCHQLSSKLEPGEISDSMGRCLARSELCALHVPHCLAQLRCGYASTSLQYSSAPFWPQVAFTVIEARGATLKSGG